MFQSQMVPSNLDDSQMMTLRLKSGCHIRFEVDTGAQCNILLLEVYKKATKDVALVHITPKPSHITAYGGTTLPVVRTMPL